jgi:hypothetical protein
VTSAPVTVKLVATDTSGASNFVIFTININSPQSVQHSNADDNSLYYNNTTKMLEIKFSPAASNICHLLIYDMLGKIQYAKSIYPSVTANIDLSFLNKGIYLTTLQSKNNRMSKKIIVLK